MKPSIILIYLILFVIGACRKDSIVCGEYTDITKEKPTIDTAPLNQVKAFSDTLKKYPQLVPYRVINDNYMVGMHCEVYFNGLLVLNDHYSLFYGKSDKSIFTLDRYILDTLDFSLTPALNFEDAISIAKQNMNYVHTCIAYRLCIKNISDGSNNKPKNYKLVWLVQGLWGYPYVILDANNGQVYNKFDGIYR
jgi:hypothetical protein